MEGSQLFQHRSSLFSGKLWMIILIPLLASLIPLILTFRERSPIEVIPPILILVLTFGLIAFIQLEYRISFGEMKFRFRPFVRWKTASLNDYSEVQILKISPLKEFGGWGLRYGSRLGKAYTSHGEHILHFVPKDGQKPKLMSSWKPGQPFNVSIKEQELDAVEQALKATGIKVTRQTN
jgi:hypothetical protein